MIISPVLVVLMVIEMAELHGNPFDTMARPYDHAAPY
jgi:hypothetical protein